MRITAASIIVLVCALAAVGLIVNHTADADGHGCPSDWPAQQGAASPHGLGSIDYNGFHTDGDGERWFVIRSTDSNGYATIRAYVADDGYDSGYRSSSPDETCYLIVRRPSDTEDAAKPTQISFQEGGERENLGFVDELFASLSASEISCIRSVIGENPTLQTQRLMDKRNVLPIIRCIPNSQWYDESTIIFSVKLFAFQDGGRSYNTVNCLIGVSTKYPRLVHLRLGTGLTQGEQLQLAPASGELTACLSPAEQIQNLLNIVLAQDALDSVSNGNYIISAINASTNSALNSCVDGNNVRSRLEEIRGMSVIESFQHFPNDELLNCLLLDQQTATDVYAQVASTRAGIASPARRLSPDAEACFKTFATASTYQQLVTLAVDPERVTGQAANLANLDSLVQQGFACITPDPSNRNDPRLMDFLTAFLSSNLALSTPL
ncbi:MAG: hypothetical protein F4W95_04990 [Chloroflexi bacterium]|nr:hypothetical protein [Chloroflexota bacterium]MYD47826.1 hypothetical protein [Chloroflexota bacterium]